MCVYTRHQLRETEREIEPRASFLCLIRLPRETRKGRHKLQGLNLHMSAVVCVCEYYITGSLLLPLLLESDWSRTVAVIEQGPILLLTQHLTKCRLFSLSLSLALSQIGELIL